MSTAVEFRPLDIAVVLVYLLGMLGMGMYFARKNNSTEEYFVGGRSFPGWAIGLSMLGTSISSITFLAFPATAYQSDWHELVFNLTLPFVAVFAVVVFIPFFRRGKLTSAFEYLGERFGPEVRLYGTISSLILQLIRISTILSLIAIPVHLLTGLDMSLVIICVGIFISVYTVAGGIDAVIWTDVVQSIVLWFGGAVCLFAMINQLPGGLTEILETARDHRKFGLGSLDFDLTKRTFWTLSMLGIFQWLSMTTSDQTFVQRYVASGSLREARKATLIYTVCAVPTWIFFFFVGTSLFAYYTQLPDPRIAGLPADSVFPMFILTQIPPGVAGLVISGVLAAAMSSIDSSLNSIATLVTVDIVKPYFARGRSDRFFLTTARVLATVAAVIMIVGALVIQRLPKESMNTFNLIVLSIFGGCLVGLFLLGFFSVRVDRTAAAWGVVAAILANVYLALGALKVIPESWRLPLHEYWVGMSVNVVFFVTAYGLGLLRNADADRQKGRLTGLTVWTQGDGPIP